MRCRWCELHGTGRGLYGNASRGGTGCAAAGNGTRKGRKPSGLGCLEETESGGPFVSPQNSAEVLSKFSATLIYAGTRDLALGGALYTHMQPSNAEDDAELHGGKRWFMGSSTTRMCRMRRQFRGTVFCCDSKVIFAQRRKPIGAALSHLLQLTMGMRQIRSAASAQILLIGM